MLTSHNAGDIVRDVTWVFIGSHRSTNHNAGDIAHNVIWVFIGSHRSTNHNPGDIAHNVTCVFIGSHKATLTTNPSCYTESFCDECCFALFF